MCLINILIPTIVDVCAKLKAHKKFILKANNLDKWTEYFFTDQK